MAERARRQYDAVEPENRLVARSLERAWEEKLRAVEAVEQEHARWRGQEPLLIGPVERAGLQALGENLPQIWNAATTSAADRKRILRFVIREVILDQKRIRGQVWLQIVWQTGATSEHHVQRRVHAYRNYIDIDRLRQRIVELNAEHKMDAEIAAILNQEGFVAARGDSTTSSNRPMRLTPRVAGFRSEYPAGFKLECMAGFVGTRTRAYQRIASARSSAMLLISS
ncbi:hypothetical protein [Bradyrhizobium sp. GM2.2]|uniref:hypothetical protein n=1 Tax=Bradyrhizobium sp. GM2.2 TaxID=3156358 RepID=UPI003395D137